MISPSRPVGADAKPALPDYQMAAMPEEGMRAASLLAEGGEVAEVVPLMHRPPATDSISSYDSMQSDIAKTKKYL